MAIEIFYQDADLIVVKKESGMHVHPPENKDIPIQWDRILMYQLKNQIQKKIYPVHRLDVATSGLLVLALSSECASSLCRQFAEQRVQKRYKAVARGFVKDAEAICLPLKLDSTGDLVEATTNYKLIKKIEIDQQVTPKYPKARYSLVEVEPKTGRYHQIRRHFNRISSPLIGDNAHGDSHHNRFFREKMHIDGLCLVADYLSFIHPTREEKLEFHLEKDQKWEQIYRLFEL